MINETQLTKLLLGHRVVLMGSMRPDDYSIPTNEDLEYVEPVEEIVRITTCKSKNLQSCRIKWKVGQMYRARMNTRTPSLWYCPDCREAYASKQEIKCSHHSVPVDCLPLYYEILSIKLRPLSEVSLSDARKYGCLNRKHFVVEFLNFKHRLLKPMREALAGRKAFDVINGVHFTSEGNPVVMGREINYNPLIWIKEVRMVK